MSLQEKPNDNGRTEQRTLDPALREIISAQREFFATGKTRDVSFRRGLLKNLRFMIRDNEGLILEALRADLGKSFSEGYLTEIGMVEQEINHTLRYLKTWTSPKTTATPYFLWPASSRKLSHPRGLVMIFSPWNYPFLLTMQPLISSIAAGNCTILKLSEHSPHTTKLLCYLIDKYFDREYIAAYTDSFEAVKAIRYEPFGMVFYTGGPTVARIISKAAATQLTPVVMELGGKSPCIIDKTANLKLAAKRIVAGKLINSGQTCVAPDYLYVDSSVKEEFLGYVKDYHDKFCSLSPCENKFYPKIINRMHFERLKKYLDDGEIIFGGDVSAENCRIGLTLMQNIKKDSKLMTEEIFGPILPVFEFNDINIVINTLRKRPKPLALYLFTKSRETRDMVLENLDFGCGCINDTVMQLANPHLPFGGVGESGFGRYHGKAGFDTFSNESSVLMSSPRIDLNPLRYPPYDDNYGLAKIMLRYFI